MLSDRQDRLRTQLDPVSRAHPMMDCHLSSVIVEAEDSLQQNVRRAAPAWIRKPGKGVRCDAEEQQPSELKI